MVGFRATRRNGERVLDASDPLTDMQRIRRMDLVKLSERVRKAVRDDERSLRALARKIDIDVAVLSRFARNKTGLALPTLDRLVAVLGLELVPRKSPRVTQRKN